MFDGFDFVVRALFFEYRFYRAMIHNMRATFHTATSLNKFFTILTL